MVMAVVSSYIVVPAVGRPVVRNSNDATTACVGFRGERANSSRGTRRGAVMGFLDKAKAAASDLAAKADSALNSSGAGGPKPPGAGDVDKYFHDLGVLTYLEASGRDAAAAERDRVMTALQGLDAGAAIRSFALHTAPASRPCS